jgi:phosphatidylglycerol:prolipoprotein diacylglycerol transferase
VPARFTAEICAAPLALGYALGRVGCFLVNDDYGIPTSLPWGMKFPDGLPPTTVSNLQQMGVHFPLLTDPMQVVAVHPTQIYETGLMLFVFWWLWRRRDHGHAIGWLWAWYMVLAGAERFLVEIVRAKDDRLSWLAPFSLAQATSVLIMIVGGFLIYQWRTPANAVAQPFPDSLRRKERSAPSV